MCIRVCACVRTHVRVCVCECARVCCVCTHVHGRTLMCACLTACACDWVLCPHVCIYVCARVCCVRRYACTRVSVSGLCVRVGDMHVSVCVLYRWVCVHATVCPCAFPWDGAGDGVLAPRLVTVLGLAVSALVPQGTREDVLSRSALPPRSSVSFPFWSLGLARAACRVQRAQSQAPVVLQDS